MCDYRFIIENLRWHGCDANYLHVSSAQMAELSPEVWPSRGPEVPGIQNSPRRQIQRSGDIASHYYRYRYLSFISLSFWTLLYHVNSFLVRYLRQKLNLPWKKVFLAFLATSKNDSGWNDICRNCTYCTVPVPTYLPHYQSVFKLFCLHLQVPVENRFNPAMLFSSMKQYKVKIGLWIDLTNTSRFYERHQVTNYRTRYLNLIFTRFPCENLIINLP